MNTPGSQAGTNEIGILDDFKRDGSDSMPDDGHGGDIDEDARANGGVQEACSDEDDEDKENIQQLHVVPFCLVLHLKLRKPLILGL